MQPGDTVLPRFISVGGKKYYYKDCNYYQRPIYKMMTLESKKVMDAQGKDIVEMHEANGVLKFLINRFISYQNIKEVKESIYE